MLEKMLLDGSLYGEVSSRSNCAAIELDFSLQSNVVMGGTNKLLPPPQKFKCVKR